jgi:hypothetical protein
VPRRSTGPCRGTGLYRTSSRPHIDIRIAEDKHGPAENRNYQYVPTFILRGLTELHLEFTL